MRLVSHVHRAIHKSGLNVTEFARESGIARSTLEKLIGNHFSEIRRDTIERLAARLKIHDLTELFSLQRDEKDFLEPFATRRSVTFVFGTHDVTDPRARRIDGDQAAMRTTIDLWDVRTQTEFLNFVRLHEPEVRDEMVFYSKRSFGEKERREVLDLVRRHNTVIVGSPKVNPACEAVLCALYRGSPGQKGRRAQGPGLRLSDDGRLEGSILFAEGHDQAGVVDAESGRMIAACEYAGAAAESSDVGILINVFRPLGTAEEVMLVIAAGVSGCGTYGVVKELVDSPPVAADLMPGRPVERAVRTTYKKPTESLRDDRRITRVKRVSSEPAGGGDPT